MRSSALISVLLGCVPLIASSNPKIADGAIMEITERNYPKTVAEWGRDGVRRINELLPLAAEVAASSPQCDRVEIVELSGQRSKPKSKIVFFADCANGKRFYIDAAQIESRRPAKSQEEKTAAITDVDAISSCEAGTKRKLRNPRTFKRHAFSTSVYRAPTTGNIVVGFEFEAKNDIGTELSSKVRCVITDQGLESVEVERF